MLHLFILIIALAAIAALAVLYWTHKFTLPDLRASFDEVTTELRDEIDKLKSRPK